MKEIKVRMVASDPDKQVTQRGPVGWHSSSKEIAADVLAIRLRLAGVIGKGEDGVLYKPVNPDEVKTLYDEYMGSGKMRGDRGG